MNRYIIISVCVLSIACAHIAAQGNQTSQPPSPSESKQGHEVQPGQRAESQNPNKNSDASKTLSAQSNLPVSPQSQPVTTDSRTKKNDESSEDWRIVLFTGILTIVAVLQFIAMVFQSKYMRDQLRQMKAQAEENAVSFNQTLNEMTTQSTALQATAEAAKKSSEVAERTLVLTQRPFIYVDTINFIAILDEKKVQSRWTVQLKWKNTGQTPAFNVACQVGLRSKKADVPKTPNDITHAAIGPNMEIGSAFIDISRDLAERLQRGVSTIFLYGIVDYSDGFPDTPRRHLRTIHEILVSADIPLDGNQIPFSHPVVDVYGD